MYVYLVRGIETPVVGVYSSEVKAIQAGKEHLEDNGVIDGKWVVREVNDWLTTIHPADQTSCFEKITIERHTVQ